jgi:hypothetical protein
VGGGEMRQVKEKISEADIQAAVEDYLIQRGITFFRIPDALFRTIFAGSVPLWVKSQISQYIKGWPDLFIFKNEPELKYTQCLFLELKKKGGKISQGQKKIANMVTVEYAYSVEEAIEKIEEFMEDNGKI